MSVMASKGLAAEMIEDAAAFVRSGTDTETSRLAPAEHAVATASVQHRYFLLTIVPRPAEFESLARDLAGFSVGRDLLRAYARGLLGLAKWGTSAMRERARIIRLAVGLAMLSCGARSGR